MKITAGIDTHILIWGMPQPSRPRQGQDVQAMRQRASLLFSMLEKQDATVVIPTVVVSEFLVGIASEKRGRVLSDLSSRFRCASYDVRACDFAANLWDKARALPKAELPQDRQVLKADLMIVATAKIAGATRFFSHEASCRKLADLAGMSGCDLPTHNEDLWEWLKSKSED
jgi:predicted nucleic acid-binding protein